MAPALPAEPGPDHRPRHDRNQPGPELRKADERPGNRRCHHFGQRDAAFQPPRKRQETPAAQILKSPRRHEMKMTFLAMALALSAPDLGAVELSSAMRMDAAARSL